MQSKNSRSNHSMTIFLLKEMKRDTTHSYRTPNLSVNISEPIRGDCNRFVEQIFSDQFCHNLVFIDMEGFDVTWESMERIIQSKSDIIINFPTSCFERTKALENQQCLDKFYGDHTWVEKATDRDIFLVSTWKN